MSLWDKEVAIHSERIKNLPRPKLQMFMVACLDHAFAANNSSFSKTVDPSQLHIARATLDRLWSCLQDPDSTSDFQAILESLYSIMPGEDDPADLVPGWYYTTAVLASIIRGMIGDHLLKEATTAVDAAYQSICEDELNKTMLRMGNGLCGEEITEAERASSICRKEIAFQLQCLTAIEDGRPIVRSNSD